MKNGMNPRFLSCREEKLQSFLSCALRNTNRLTSRSNLDRKIFCASSLSCKSNNAPEAESQNVKDYRANRLILGIDPGITGALAIVKAGPLPCYVAVYDLPTKVEKNGKKRLDIDALSFLVSTYSQDGNLAIVEEVGQIGTKADPFSSFVFGFATGAVHGVLASHSFPIQTVKPNIWKAVLGLDSDKNKSIQKAIKFFPQAANQLKRKMDHGRAEALLLAYFANSLTWRTAK